MSRILLVALAFEVLLHLVQTAAKRRTGRSEHPGTFGATPNLYARGFDPHDLSPRSFHELLFPSLLQQFFFAMNIH